MPAWNMNGLILEGIAGSGKSTVLRALTAHDCWTKKPYLSSIILSEHQTQRVLEAKERQSGLQVEDHLTLLADIIGMLEQFSRRLSQMDWAERRRDGHKLAYALERFHLSHVYHYPDMSWEYVQPIDERLCALQAKVCILTIGEHVIRQRIIDDTKKQWKSYLEGIGGNEEIIAHFQRQQETLLQLLQRTQLPCRVIDTSVRSVESIVEEIFAFWRL